MEKFRIIEIKEINDKFGNECILVSANPVKENPFSLFVDNMVNEDTCYFVFPYEDQYGLPLVGLANAMEIWTPEMNDFIKQKSLLNGRPTYMYMHMNFINEQKIGIISEKKNTSQYRGVNFHALDLGLSVRWADKNYISPEGVEYFSWEEAKGIENLVPGWRLPSKNEVEELLYQRSWNNSSDGGYDIVWGEILHIDAVGYMDSDECISKGTSGSYWTSTRYDSQQAYYLFFNQNYQYVDYYLNSCKFAIRLVSI